MLERPGSCVFLVFFVGMQILHVIARGASGVLCPPRSNLYRNFGDCSPALASAGANVAAKNSGSQRRIIFLHTGSSIISDVVRLFNIYACILLIIKARTGKHFPWKNSLAPRPLSLDFF